jgi:aspartyl-tRNA(Asn)/glutamyl-tRNA(Gln) amidotransferase subunit C
MANMRIEFIGMSQTLTPADVERIATLARLELTSDEVTLFATQLTAILAYADQVRAVDTSGVPSDAAIITRADQRMRDDEPLASLDRDTVISEAPGADRATGLFKVPRVLGS